MSWQTLAMHSIERMWQHWRSGPHITWVYSHLRSLCSPQCPQPVDVQLTSSASSQSFDNPEFFLRLDAAEKYTQLPLIGMSLVCHCCVTGVSLLCHWCVSYCNNCEGISDSGVISIEDEMEDCYLVLWSWNLFIYHNCALLRTHSIWAMRLTDAIHIVESNVCDMDGTSWHGHRIRNDSLVIPNFAPFGVCALPFSTVHAWWWWNNSLRHSHKTIDKKVDGAK